MKESLDRMDEIVSKARESMQDIKTRAKDHVQLCTDIKIDVMCRCEQVESLVSSLQAPDTFHDARDYLTGKAQVVRDSSSPSLSSKTLPDLIGRAQGVAKLRAQSLDRYRLNSWRSYHLSQEKLQSPRFTSTILRTNSWNTLC